MKMHKNIVFSPLYTVYSILFVVYCIPGRKSGMLRIQYGHAAAAAAAEISFWTR